jgi:hypothetical protein
MSDMATTTKIREALEQGNDRPVYMVLRHLGIEPDAAVDALYGAGLTPKQYGTQCRELTPEQLTAIVASAR